VLSRAGLRGGPVVDGAVGGPTSWTFRMWPSCRVLGRISRWRGRRLRLAGLIPSVIGLTGDDLHIDARIALRSATMALPVAAAGRQRVMAVSVLACERVLAELDGRPVGSLQEQSRLALAQVPHAAQWAGRFTSGVRGSQKGFRRQAAPVIVRDAVEGIAQACIPDPDGMLRDLLVQAIAECAAWTGREPNRGAALDTAVWASAVRPTGG
jgi:hypothetical protein